MKGHVDSIGRALIAISIRPLDGTSSHAIEAWIDTGFNGDLVLPQTRIDDLGLMPSGTLKAILADGSEVALLRYTCMVDWFGEDRELEVLANDGEYPLLGVGLLIGRELRISFRAGEVTID